MRVASSNEEARNLLKSVWGENVFRRDEHGDRKRKGRLV